jgi:VanZ family protein
MRSLYFVPAVLWFIVTIILLTLPGNDLPHSPLFDFPYFDKYVHLVMFFLLTTLFCFPFSTIKAKQSYITRVFLKITLCVISYGIIIEFVQKFFTTTRSFDVIDILFDSVGSLSGLVAIRQYAFKKIGPNENRGRNQN